MKTKHLKITILSMLIAVSTSFAGGYKVKTDASSVKWNGKKVSGEHYGSISLLKGEFVLKDDKLAGGTFVVDMNSITNDDLSGEWNKKLVGHLKSDDFFGVENHPTSKLVVKEVKHKSGNAYSFDGELTIKGKTEPISFDADVSFGESEIKASGKIVIDRTLFDVRYGSGKFFENLGDKMINDEFTLEYNLVASK